MKRKPQNALAGAAACLLGLIVSGAMALLLPAAKMHDSAGLAGFTSLADPTVSRWANRIADLVNPNQFTITVIALAVIALLRRRPRMALVVPCAMLAATTSTELLKTLVAEPRFSLWLDGDGGSLSGSWPSGHATAAMTVALSAMIVAPRLLRPFVAFVGTVLAVAVSYSVLVLGWHFPSDVLGGFLIAGVWTSLAVAALWWRPAPVLPTPRASVHLPMVLNLGIGGVGVVTLAVLMRGDLRQSYDISHVSFLAALFAIAALAVTLASGLFLALRD